VRIHAEVVVADAVDGLELGAEVIAEQVLASSPVWMRPWSAIRVSYHSARSMPDVVVRLDLIAERLDAAVVAIGKDGLDAECLDRIVDMDVPVVGGDGDALELGRLGA